MNNLIIDNIEQLVERGESFEMVVTGYSMLPLLGYGRDRIVLHRTTDTEDIMHRAAMFRMADASSYIASFASKMIWLHCRATATSSRGSSVAVARLSAW